MGELMVDRCLSVQGCACTQDLVLRRGHLRLHEAGGRRAVRAVDRGRRLVPVCAGSPRRRMAGAVQVSATRAFVPREQSGKARMVVAASHHCAFASDGMLFRTRLTVFNCVILVLGGIPTPPYYARCGVNEELRCFPTRRNVRMNYCNTARHKRGSALGSQPMYTGKVFDHACKAANGVVSAAKVCCKALGMYVARKRAKGRVSEGRPMMLGTEPGANNEIFSH